MLSRSRALRSQMAAAERQAGRGQLAVSPSVYQVRTLSCQTMPVYFPGDTLACFGPVSLPCQLLGRWVND